MYVASCLFKIKILRADESCKCCGRKRLKAISQNWKQEMASPLPWKTLELPVFGICVIGTNFVDILESGPLSKFRFWYIYGFVGFRFWPNNKSRMYLLENTGKYRRHWTFLLGNRWLKYRSHDFIHLLIGDFVRVNGLQEGDFIVIYSDTKCGKYVRLIYAIY